MTHYIDIKLYPKKEIRENVLLNQVHTAFHRRLYDLKSNDIGVSFPEYHLKLGKLFRIHSSQESLLKLQEEDWLGKYSEYCKISSIQNIPEKVEYKTVSRIQQNMTASKLRRLIKRGSISDEEVKMYKIKMLQGGLDNPYVELVSMSNGKLHRRFINFGDLQSKETKGEFDSFGLSKVATIPIF